MMKHPFLLLILAIMVLMVAFAFEICTYMETDDHIAIVHQVVRDGTWVDTSATYKLSEKKHFWGIP